MTKEKLIIIGSGPAGLTAALYASRAELSPLVFEGKEPGGQLMWTTEIENFPGVPDHTTGPSLMNRMREQAQKFGARTVFEIVDRVDFSDSENLKVFSGDKEYVSSSIIIATGASARWLDLGKGEEKYWGKGYTACATCDGAFYRNKIVGVVGGGDTACEEADFLTKFATKVYMFQNLSGLTASKPMQARVTGNPKIEIQCCKLVTDLRGDPSLQEVELTDANTGEKSVVALDGLFVAIGRKPSTAFLKGQIDLDEYGYVRSLDETHTHVPSVFVAGDCADWKYRQAIVAAGAGCKAALEVERYLAGKE